jgi:hypothetical protein
VVLIAGFFVFYGLFQGIFRTAGKAMASGFVPDHLRASGIGWYNTQSEFYSLSQASSQAGFGIASGMARCFTTGRPLLLSVLSPYGYWLTRYRIVARIARRK